MGIKQLMQLIKQKASQAIQQIPISRYQGQIVACDASMAMYQFLIATQYTGKMGPVSLSDSQGNPTSHLLGLFNRTIMFLQHGVRPIWVFDGKPPDLKSHQLQKRKKLKQEAAQKMQEAAQQGKTEQVVKMKQRSVHISAQMTQDAKTMLRLMGVPVVQAPGEAEAQCACFVRHNKAFAVASQDTDSLTFGARYLLRRFNSKKEPIQQITLEEVLRGMDLNQAEFVDLCILMGCDYTNNIEGIGPVNAFNLIKQHSNIENILVALKNKPKKRQKVPIDFNYEAARELFFNPDVSDPESFSFQWDAPQAEELIGFLVGSKGFGQARVDSGLLKINQKRNKPTQMRIENFFGRPVITKRASTVGSTPNKRVKRGRK